MSQTEVKKKSPAGIIIGVIFMVFIFGAIAMFALKNFMPAKKAESKDEKLVVKPEMGDLISDVIETGPLEARKTVEVKSRVAGRVRLLNVEESDTVIEGEQIAIIDPQETQLQVKQNRAQLSGAEANVRRTTIEIAQRRVTAQTNLDRANSRLRQLELELKQQPILTSTAITSAKSAYDSAVQALNLLTTATQANARTAAESQLDEARANHGNAKIEYDRRQGLLEKGYISKRDFEQAELNLNLAKTRLDQAQENYNRVAGQQKLERQQAEERVRQAKADLDRAKANSIQDNVKREEYIRAGRDVQDARAALRDVDALMQSRNQQRASVDQIQSVLSDSLRLLGETEIRAPVSGIVVKKLVQPGELVSSLSSFSSGTPIVRIEDRSTMRVKLNINEIDVAKLTVGKVAEIRIDAFPTRVYKGRVTKIAPASNDSGATAVTAQNSVVKYAVEVELNNSDKSLKSGMSAKCSIRVFEKKNVLRVRSEAIGKDPDGRTYVLKLGNEPIPDQTQIPGGPKPKAPKTEKVYVDTGESTGAFIEVLSGVKVGERLWKPDSKIPSRLGFMGGRQADDNDKPEEEKDK